MYECESFIRDWMRADFALLNSRRTRQQEASAQYVETKNISEEFSAEK